MGVPRGSPKHGGRQKGSKNLPKVELEKKIADSGWDPIAAMCRIGMKAEQEGEYALAIQCAKELANYQHAKKRSVEVRAEPDSEKVSFNITLSDSLKLIEDAAVNAGMPRPEPIDTCHPAEPPIIFPATLNTLA